MKYRYPHVLIYTAILIAFVGCWTDPQTHRSHSTMFTHEKEGEIGAELFRQFLEDPRTVVIKNTPEQHRVLQVFARLVDAAKRSTYAEQAKGLQWEVVLIKSSGRTGSFSLPGGKVGVYSGLLSFAETDGELAGAMGNSMASVLARHGSERMSRSVFQQILFLGSIHSASTKEDPALVELQQEEADKIGILLAADAGYDPDEAFRMWLKAFGTGPRLDSLRLHLQEARDHYDKAQSSQTPTIHPQ